MRFCASFRCLVVVFFPSVGASELGRLEPSGVELQAAISVHVEEERDGGTSSWKSGQ